MPIESVRAIAGMQQGFFTTAQAAEQGVSRRALAGMARRGSLQGIGYGLYRLDHWPIGPLDDLHALQTRAPFGTFSHETALNLLGLSDLNPDTLHFTIPETARLAPRPGIRLHRSRHRAAEDRVLRDGLWVSTPVRALLDSARSGADPDQLIEAARDAKARAMLTVEEIARLRQHTPFRGAVL